MRIGLQSIYLSVRPALLTALLLLSPAGHSVTSDPTTFLQDNSDWWSLMNGRFTESKAEPQNRELSAANFRVLGVSLGEDQFDKLAFKVGRASVLERGDALTSRTQVCYVSPAPERVHLIFESGEVPYALYLFTGGDHWQGEDFCLPTPLVSKKLGIASGLHLGMTPRAVLAILGKPSVASSNRLMYWLETRKKTPPGDLAELRSNNRDLSEPEFHKNYDFFDLSVYVEARFNSTGLNFLAISKIESY